MTNTARLALVVVVAAAGCKKSDDSDGETAKQVEPAPVESDAADGGTAAAGDPEAVAGGGAPGIAVPGLATDGGAAAEAGDEQRAAIRCELDGPPMRGDCGKKPIRTIAVAADGAIYLVDGAGSVRRYTRDADVGDEACRLRLDTAFGAEGILPAPEVPPAPQKLDGPVYMRSGGPEWQLAASDDAVYLYDFLGGVQRISGTGAGASACAPIPGLRALTFDGNTAYAVRGADVFRVAMNARGCKLVPAKVATDIAHPTLAVVDGTFYLGGRTTESHEIIAADAKGTELARMGNADSFADGGMCYVTGIADCGDAVCAIDGNCRDVEIFDKKSGAWRRAIGFSDAFGSTYGVGGVDVDADGDLWFSVMLKTGHGLDAPCDGAVFRMPRPE